MKNRISLYVLPILILALQLLVANIVTGQSATDEINKGNAPFTNDVKSVSARIASMYGADTAIVERFVQASVNLESRIGIAAPVVIAIAIHESSFKSELYVKAGNPFGIKASKPWVGPTYSKWHDGEETKFRLYGSTVEAIWDLGNFVKSRSWYADALACPIDDSRCVIDGLKKNDFEPGFSVNPNWDEAILDIIQKLRLQELATR